MDTFHVEFEAMACACELHFAAPTGLHVEKLANQVIDEVKRIEQKYSRYNTISVISEINRNAGSDQWSTVDTETLNLLQLAQRMYKDSDGLFDITSGVLRNAWDFKKALIPTPEDLTHWMSRIGISKLEISGHQVRLALEGMEIDLGGFGKEYAVDQAAQLLHAQGVRHGLVNLGGDVFVLGPKPDGQAWTLGIQHPRNTGSLLASIPVTQGGLASSGDYERYFEKNGQRYCHILNPRTGHPVSYWQSVSVLAPNTLTAGFLTTLCMLRESDGLGPLKASGLDFIAVDHTGQIFTKRNS